MESPVAAPTSGNSGSPASPPNTTFAMLFPVLLVAVMYFIMIRPHNKREKEKKKALKTLTKGDKVITRGGIWGVVVGIKEDEGIVVLKVSDNVKMEFSKTAIDIVNPPKNIEKTEVKK